MKYEIYHNGETQTDTLFTQEDAKRLIRHEASNRYNEFGGYKWTWIGTKGLHVIIHAPGRVHEIEARRAQ